MKVKLKIMKVKLKMMKVKLKIMKVKLTSAEIAPSWSQYFPGPHFVQPSSPWAAINCSNEEYVPGIITNIARVHQ